MTLAPTVYIGDSAEFITASYTLGVAHPPGFPLYTILGKVFSLIPLNSIAWRINLMSAFFGALTVSLVYLIIHKLTKKYLVAAAASLTLGFSQLFWSQSLFAEVYTLNSFFAVLLFLILLIWSENKKIKNLYWFSFLFGLSITNHTMMILLAPAFALYIILVDSQILKNIKLIIKMFLFFLLGLLVYLYLPMRSAQKAEFLWSEINSLTSFWSHVTRSQYGDVEIFGDILAKLNLGKEFLVELVRQFLWPAIVAALTGLIVLFKKSYKLAVFTFAVFIFNSLAIIFLRSIGMETNIHEVYKVYYLPALMVVVIWLGIFISWIIDLVKVKIKFHKVFEVIIIILFFSSAVYLLTVNFERNDLSNFWLTYNYAKDTLDSMEENAVLFYIYDGTTTSDTEIFNLVYLKMVENYRSDIAIISEHNFFYKDFNLEFPLSFFQLDNISKRDELLKLTSQINNQDIYINNILNQRNNSLGFFSLANGLVYKIYPNLEKAKQDITNINFRVDSIGQERAKEDEVIKKLVAHHYYNLAVLYLNQNNQRQSDYYLQEALRRFSSQEYIDYLQYQELWQK